MAIGAFPLVKLGILLVKQISKPIANGVASRAEKSKAFRNYVCIPIAQLFHLYDVKVRMRVLNLGKVSKEKVPKLNEKKAIETGAQLLSEFILVAVASIIVIYEYNRSMQKEEKKQIEIEQEKSDLKDRVQDLEFAVEKQSTQLKELTRLAIAIRDDLQKSLLPKPTNSGFFSKKDGTQVPSLMPLPPIPPELMDVFEKDNLKRNNQNVDSSDIKDNINNAADNNLQNVGFLQTESYRFSKLQYLDWRDSHFEGSENVKSFKIIPGTITTIVLEHFNYSDNELMDA